MPITQTLEPDPVNGFTTRQTVVLLAEELFCDYNSHTIAESYGVVRDALPPEARRRRQRSTGDLVYQHTVQLALSRMVREGVLTSPMRGLHQSGPLFHSLELWAINLSGSPRAEANVEAEANVDSTTAIDSAAIDAALGRFETAATEVRDLLYGIQARLDEGGGGIPEGGTC